MEFKIAVLTLIFSLITHGFVDCHPKAQLLPLQSGFLGAGRGSNSAANSQAFSRGFDLGNIFGVSSSRANAESFTRNNGGFLHGGSNSFSRADSISNGFNVGALGISNTLSSSKGISSNGLVSGEVKHDLDVGNVGVGTSLSTSNVMEGIGVRPNLDGGVNVGLGPIAIKVKTGNQREHKGIVAQTNSGASAFGSDARTDSKSHSNTKMTVLGALGFTSSKSKSESQGSSSDGATNSFAGGTGNDAHVLTGTNSDRFKRGSDYYYDVLRRNREISGLRRRPIGNGFAFPQNGFSFPQTGFSSGPGGFPAFQQNSGANTQSANWQNTQGIFQKNIGSAQGSNLANDGSSGQLSAANTAQQNYQTAKGSGNKNSAQGQSAIFDNDMLGLSSSNADTSYIQGINSDRIEANSGSNAALQNEFGNSANSAQTNTATFNENGVMGSQSTGLSQSLFAGLNGGVSVSNSGSNSHTFNGPNGIVGSSASSQSSSFTNGNSGQVGSSSTSLSGSNTENGFGGFSGAQSGSFEGGYPRRGESGAGSKANSQTFTGFGLFGSQAVTIRNHSKILSKVDERNLTENTNLLDRSYYEDDSEYISLDSTENYDENINSQELPLSSPDISYEDDNSTETADIFISLFGTSSEEFELQYRELVAAGIFKESDDKDSITEDYDVEDDDPDSLLTFDDDDDDDVNQFDRFLNQYSENILTYDQNSVPEINNNDLNMEDNEIQTEESDNDIRFKRDAHKHNKKGQIRKTDFNENDNYEVIGPINSDDSGKSAKQYGMAGEYPGSGGGYSQPTVCNYNPRAPPQQNSYPGRFPNGYPGRFPQQRYPGRFPQQSYPQYPGQFPPQPYPGGYPPMPYPRPGIPPQIPIASPPIGPGVPVGGNVGSTSSSNSQSTASSIGGANQASSNSNSQSTATNARYEIQDARSTSNSQASSSGLHSDAGSGGHSQYTNGATQTFAQSQASGIGVVA